MFLFKTIKQYTNKLHTIFFQAQILNLHIFTGTCWEARCSGWRWPSPSALCWQRAAPPCATCCQKYSAGAYWSTSSRPNCWVLSGGCGRMRTTCSSSCWAPGCSPWLPTGSCGFVKNYKWIKTVQVFPVSFK